jgi:hypothetical protein
MVESAELEELKVALVCARWACAFLGRSLADTSAAIARVDRRAAEEMILTAEREVANEVAALGDELIKRGQNTKRFAEIASMVRNAIADAKDAVKQAANPH